MNDFDIADLRQAAPAKSNLKISEAPYSDFVSISTRDVGQRVA
jgi:hypothetical protein